MNKSSLELSNYGASVPRDVEKGIIHRHLLKTVSGLHCKGKKSHILKCSSFCANRRENHYLNRSPLCTSTFL